MIVVSSTGCFLRYIRYWKTDNRMTTITTFGTTMARTTVTEIGETEIGESEVGEVPVGDEGVLVASMIVSWVEVVAVCIVVNADSLAAAPMVTGATDLPTAVVTEMLSPVNWTDQEGGPPPELISVT